MFNHAKYLVIDNIGGDIPYIFPNHINHANFAMGMHGDVVSAGFVTIGDSGHINCFGESISLKKKSRPAEDIYLITKMFGKTIGGD